MFVVLRLCRSYGASKSQTRGEAEKIAARAFEVALQSSYEPTGQWILSPHAEAASESAWAGILSGSLHQIRVDRLFRAGLKPPEPAGDTLWIIDYKTTHAESGNAASSLPALRKLFAPQLEMYATILRPLHQSDTPIRAGLYYPRMSLFDWWEI